MATIEEIKESIAQLADYYDNYTPPNSDWVALYRRYYRQWKDIPGEVLNISTDVYIRKHAWFPKPNQLIDVAEDVLKKINSGEEMLNVFERDNRYKTGLLNKKALEIYDWLNGCGWEIKEIRERWGEIWKPLRSLHKSLRLPYPTVAAPSLDIDSGDIELVEPPEVNISGKSWLDFSVT